MLSIGLFASSLTSSSTVAFVLGALFCAIPVLIGVYLRGYVFLERFGVDWHLRDFTIGLLSFSSILYFVSLTIFMLYLNLIVITRRHWSRGRQVGLAGQFRGPGVGPFGGLGFPEFHCRPFVGGHEYASGFDQGAFVLR